MPTICCPACGSTLRVELGVVRMTKPAPDESVMVPPAVAEAVEHVAEDAGISTYQLLGPSRLAHITEARQRAMWELRRSGMSLTEIGVVLARDHTTVHHGIRAHERRMMAAPQSREGTTLLGLGSEGSGR